MPLAEALAAVRSVPDERVVLGDEDVRPAVPDEVEHPHVPVGEVDPHHRRQRPEVGPPLAVLELEVTGDLGRADDDLLTAVGIEILERQDAAAHARERRLWPHQPRRVEPHLPGLVDVAEVRAVPPRALLLAEYARDALAVEVDPLVRAGRAGREGRNRLVARRTPVLVHGGRLVSKSGGWKGRLEVPASIGA